MALRYADFLSPEWQSGTAAVSRPPESEQALRLLVIEDDPDLNRQLTTALTDAGYVVDRAFDGEEGHYLGESEPYDAVILDIGLPKLEGFRCWNHGAAAAVRCRC
jgi:CheY-like chemotaxis protein